MSASKVKHVWVPRMYAFLRRRGGSAPRSAVIEEGMRHVPRGLAFRVGLQKRTNDSRYRNFGVEEELTKKDAATLVRAGANKVVCNSLYYERKAGNLAAFEAPDGTMWLKIATEV